MCSHVLVHHRGHLDFFDHLHWEWLGHRHMHHLFHNLWWGELRDCHRRGWLVHWDVLGRCTEGVRLTARGHAIGRRCVGRVCKRHCYKSEKKARVGSGAYFGEKIKKTRQETAKMWRGGMPKGRRYEHMQCVTQIFIWVPPKQTIPLLCDPPFGVWCSPPPAGHL